ncbi:MAG: 4-hydroxy-tetrahydrodipicolinate synthase, partial [Clostridia bacterium]|nr:4-hydroxy-tetrahydrodipicolinate synthase [Clostridia bacterium]
MVEFGRVLTAMVTPFNEEGGVDYEAAGKLARRLVENGSDGVVVAGTTGESPTLSDEEKLKLFATVVEAIGGRAVVIAGTGSNNTQKSVELTREAEKTGVDGIMAVAPYYNKPPQEGLYRHYRAIAGATSLPVMVYNVPGRTAVNIAPATM